MAAPSVRKLAVIIDDSLITRKILEVCLRREGIPSLSFADGEEALVTLHQHPEVVPAVILLDMRLPHRSGFQVAWRLRWIPAFRQTAIIVLSGHTNLPMRLKARLITDQYIAKPFKTAAIVAAVSRHLPPVQEQMSDHGLYD